MSYIVIDSRLCTNKEKHKPKFFLIINPISPGFDLTSMILYLNLCPFEY